MKKHLVFVGGGHAHLTALLHLKNYVDRGHRVTLISSSGHHYYSGMGPGMLSGIYRPQEIRFHVEKLAEDRGASFVQEIVEGINPARRTLSLKSGRTVEYDVVSFNTGSEVSAEIQHTTEENIFTVKPIINLLKARQYVLQTMKQRDLRVVVIGGGPAGVEIAGNVWRLVHDNKGKAEISFIAGEKLLKNLPERVGSLVRSSFQERDIRIIEGRHTKKMEKNLVVLDDASEIPFDVAFVATGVKPASFFKESGLPVGEDGGMLVNSYLQSVAHPEIFGGGDCISLEGHALAKVGVYAVRQNPILYQNLLSALEGGELIAFRPQKKYLLIFNLGDGKGVLWKNQFVWDGRIAFILKDYIDRKFMKKFQVSGELLEEE
ncbi:MAG: FAD-dependent oxidoreductase [Nitrospirota bacterium]|nr:FAD-dependent oxidoreductase [Nitrospirota bacterium]